MFQRLSDEGRNVAGAPFDDHCLQLHCDRISKRVLPVQPMTYILN